MSRYEVRLFYIVLNTICFFGKFIMIKALFISILDILISKHSYQAKENDS